MATRRTVKDATPQRRLKLGALENNLGYLSRMVRNVALQSSGDYVDELGFATGQITMLGLISANSGVSQNVLAQAMLMRKSQVTGLIQDLVARGYVTRGDHDADRRINTLRLTESGQQVWRSAKARIDRHSASMLSGLEEAEQQELTRLLRKLLAAHMDDVQIDFGET
jgi:DNA-binding MarR family transcriptional regulator